MDRLDEISHKRQQAHKKLLFMKSRVYTAFLEMEKAAYEDGPSRRSKRSLLPLASPS